MRLRLGIAGLTAILALAGTQCLASPVQALYDDFEGPDFSPTGGLYYKDNEEQRAGTVEFQGQVKFHRIRDRPP